MRITNNYGRLQISAHSLLFLASDDSSFVTRTAMLVDGGATFCRNMSALAFAKPLSISIRAKSFWGTASPDGVKPALL